LQSRDSLFLVPCQVSSGVLSGILNISPEKIQAVDMDSINAPIHYSFLSGNPPNYRDFFEINPNTGAVKQIRAVDTTVTKKFDIIIKVRILSCNFTLVNIYGLNCAMCQGMKQVFTFS